jgi:hypothetical protein
LGILMLRWDFERFCLQRFSFQRGNAKNIYEWRELFGQAWSPARCPIELVLHIIYGTIALAKFSPYPLVIVW